MSLGSWASGYRLRREPRYWPVAEEKLQLILFFSKRESTDLIPVYLRDSASKPL